MLQKCLDNQRPVIDRLNSEVNKAVQRSGQSKSPLFSKLCELNDSYQQVSCLAQQRRNELIDKLQQVCNNNNLVLLQFYLILHTSIDCVQLHFHFL